MIETESILNQSLNTRSRENYSSLTYYLHHKKINDEEYKIRNIEEAFFCLIFDKAKELMLDQPQLICSPSVEVLFYLHIHELFKKTLIIFKIIYGCIRLSKRFTSYNIKRNSTLNIWHHISFYPEHAYAE